MEKNKFLSTVILSSMIFVNQFTNAQTCSGDEVFMSKGCACGVKSNKCESKCVKPNQVNSLLKQGWYFGSCSLDCCHWLIKDERDTISNVHAAGKGPVGYINLDRVNSKNSVQLNSPGVFFSMPKTSSISPPPPASNRILPH